MVMEYDVYPLELVNSQI